MNSADLLDEFVALTSVTLRDAARHKLHSHAARGNEEVAALGNEKWFDKLTTNGLMHEQR